MEVDRERGGQSQKFVDDTAYRSAESEKTTCRTKIALITVMDVGG